MSGTILDGQHRLPAVVNSGQTIEALFIENLNDDIFEVLDTGKNRSSGDVLHIYGIEDATKVAAIAKFVIMFRASVISKLEQNHRYTTTNHEVLDFAVDNADRIKLVCGEKSIYKKILSHSLAGGLYFLFSEINAKDALEFMRRVTDGLELTKNSPIGVLRAKLLDDAMAKKKMSKGDKLAIIIKAWNFFRKNETITQLRFVKESENFPKPI